MESLIATGHTLQNLQEKCEGKFYDYLLFPSQKTLLFNSTSEEHIYSYQTPCFQPTVFNIMKISRV